MKWVPGRDRHAVRHARANPRPASPEAPTVVVVGGASPASRRQRGLLSAAVRVRLLEAEPTLGGRGVRGRWPDPTARSPMSRGFHAFFRQYYNLRSLLRRADPGLTRLIPIPDYPLHLAPEPGGRPLVVSFTHFPWVTPWNLVGFVAQSPSFRASDLAKVDVTAALDLLRVRFPDTYTDLDGVSAADVLRFPKAARHLAMVVFARSFFADPRDFSGGEMVAMFHTYFIGSAEGLLFDVPDDDYDTALWAPLGEYLARLGVEVCTQVRVTGIAETDTGVVVLTGTGEYPADAVVLALDASGLHNVTAAAGWLGDAAWRERVAALRTAPPFGVGRRWLAGRLSGVPAFLGTSGYGPLDNLSRLDAFEAGAARWAERAGGSVVEVHGYALSDPSDATRTRLWDEAARVHPELGAAAVLAEQWLVADDCPLVDTSPWRDRPGVRTPDPRVVLAGDLVRCDWPIALMERAATTGWQAANTLLAGFGRRGHELWSPPLTGLLAGRHLPR